MDRKNALKKLFKLKNVYNISISEQLEKLNSHDGVPREVIDFIEKHDYDITDFFTVLKEKQFYKSLKNPKDLYAKMKGLSSMLTHIIIEIEQNPEKKDLIVDALEVEKILTVFDSYFFEGDTSKLNNLVEKVKNVIGENKDG